MTNDPIKTTPEDEPPKSGEFIDQEQFYKELTDEEIAEGERLGAETPDVDFIEEDGATIFLPIGGDDDEPSTGTE